MSAIQQAMLMVSAAAPYSGWRPNNGTAPYAWYIGDDTANTADGSSNLTHLEDKSGNARHIESANIAGIKVVTNGIGSRTTLNSSAGGSTNQRMRLPSAAGMLNGAAGWCAAFALYRVDAGSGITQTLFFAETSARNTSRASFQIEGTSDDTPRIVSRRADGDSAAIQAYGSTVSDTGNMIAVAGLDLANRTVRLRINGTETTGTSFGTVGSAFSATNSYDGPWLFGTNPTTSAYEAFKGNAGEIVLYNGVIAQAEMEKIEGYLAHTWGLTSLLPGGHPYKTSAPT